MDHQLEDEDHSYALPPEQSEKPSKRNSSPTRLLSHERNDEEQTNPTPREPSVEAANPSKIVQTLKASVNARPSCSVSHTTGSAPATKHVYDFDKLPSKDFLEVVSSTGQLKVYQRGPVPKDSSKSAIVIVRENSSDVAKQFHTSDGHTAKIIRTSAGGNVKSSAFLRTETESIQIDHAVREKTESRNLRFRPSGNFSEDNTLDGARILKDCTESVSAHKANMTKLHKQLCEISKRQARYRRQLSRERKKVEKLEKDLEKKQFETSQVMREKAIAEVTQFLTGPAFAFFADETNRAGGCWGRTESRQWGPESYKFSLELYRKSPTVYMNLERIFALPSVSQIQQWHEHKHGDPDPNGTNAEASVDAGQNTRSQSDSGSIVGGGRERSESSGKRTREETVVVYMDALQPPSARIIGGTG